jgi:hypothetical protein
MNSKAAVRQIKVIPKKLNGAFVGMQCFSDGL